MRSVSALSASRRTLRARSSTRPLPMLTSRSSPAAIAGLHDSVRIQPARLPLLRHFGIGGLGIVAHDSAGPSTQREALGNRIHEAAARRRASGGNSEPRVRKASHPLAPQNGSGPKSVSQDSGSATTMMRSSSQMVGGRVRLDHSHVLVGFGHHSRAVPVHGTKEDAHMDRVTLPAVSDNVYAGAGSSPHGPRWPVTPSDCKAGVDR